MKKVALITGVASGIGRASAEILLKNGYAVVGLSRRPEMEKFPPTSRRPPLRTPRRGYNNHYNLD